MTRSRNRLDSGRFCKRSRTDHREKRLRNLSTVLHNDSSTSAAGSDFIHLEHSYQTPEEPNSGVGNSFDDVNDLFFSGKLKLLDSSCFVIDLHTLCSNMKCDKCTRSVLLDDVIGLLPSGVSGYLVVKCQSCSCFIRAAMDKTHSERGEHHTGPKVFDVNTKLTTDQSVKVQILQKLKFSQHWGIPFHFKKESIVTLTNTRPTPPNSSLDGTQIWNWEPTEEDLLVSIRHEENDMFLKSKNHTGSVEGNF